MEFPAELDCQWALSNVVLLAEDADGRELHSNKTFLALWSRYFNGLFFSGFKEASNTVVNVSCSYDILKIILKIVHGLCNDFNKVNDVYEPDVLMELFKTVDFLDFPAIRKMCIEQMLDYPSIEMVTAVLRMASFGQEMPDVMMDILLKMTSGEVKEFLATDDSQILFSKRYVKAIYKKVVGREMPDPELTYEYWWCPMAVPDLSNSMVDLTQKWLMSDLVIKTNNSDGKELHSHKAVLSTVSPHFREMFADGKESADVKEIEVDVDYMIMKNILAIIHHCHSCGNLANFLASNSMMLHDIFCASSPDKLNIPSIKELCINSLQAYPGLKNLEIAIKLDLHDSKHGLLEMIDDEELIEWLHCGRVNETGNWSFMFDDGDYTFAYSGTKNPILSLKDVRTIVQRLTVDDE